MIAQWRDRQSIRGVAHGFWEGRLFCGAQLSGGSVLFVISACETDLTADELKLQRNRICHRGLLLALVSDKKFHNGTCRNVRTNFHVH